jgi:hypothetical protein
MDETNVKIEGGGNSEVYRKVSHWSPFEFGTLKEIPFPSWGALFMILFFGVIWHYYEETVNKYINVTTLMPNLSNFVYRYHTAKKPLPEVLLVGGCTITGNTYRKTLEQRLGIPVGKAGQGGFCIWEPERILKKYHDEVKNVKVIVITLEHFAYGNIQYSNAHDLLFQRGNSFHFLKDLTDLSLSNLTFLSRIRTNKDVNKKPIFLPPRFSLRSIVAASKKADTDENYNGIERLTLKRICTDKQKKTMEKRVIQLGNNPNIQRHFDSYSDDFDRDVRKLVTYCHSKGIFIIATIPPTWYKYLPFKPDGELDELTESDHRFLSLICFLEKQPNSKVFYMKNFQDIIPNADDSELLLDTIHTTAKGTTIYTNWLADQMLNDPKVMVALKTPRQPNEFFVKKYARKGYRKITNYFKKKETPVTVAQPVNQPIR